MDTEVVEGTVEEAAPPVATEGAEPTEGQTQEEEKPTPEEAAKEEEERVSKSKRFQELIHRRKEAELAVERERAERERLELRLQALEGQPRQEPPRDRPKLSDFEDADEWAAAVADWSQEQALSRFEKKLQEKEQETAKATAARARQEAIQKFEAQEAAYKTSLGAKAVEYEEASARLTPFIRGNGELVKALLGCPPEVVHALGNDLELADSLGRMDPYSAGLALGELKARVTDKGRQGRRFSQTPAPELTVQGLRTGPGPKDYAALSGDEYAAVRRAEDAARRAQQAKR